MNMNRPDPQRTLDASINPRFRRARQVPSQLSFVGSLIQASRRAPSNSAFWQIWAGVCGILVISVISYRNMTVLIRNGHQDQRSHEFIQLLGAMERRWTTLKMATDASLSPETKATLRPTIRFGTAHRSSSVTCANSRTPTAVRGHVTHLEQLITQQLQQERNAIEVRNKTGYESVRDMALTGVAKASLDAARKLQGLMEQEENKALAQRVIESTRTTRSSIILLSIGALLLSCSSRRCTT